jgi:hypothetical protein
MMCVRLKNLTREGLNSHLSAAPMNKHPFEALTNKTALGSDYQF